MSIFSTKKTIQVSSTIYNMAGEVENRPNFLKSNIFSHVIGDGKRYLGDTLSRNYLNGPGIQQRQLQSWAVRNSFEGLPNFNVRTSNEVDLGIVKGQIEVPATPSDLQTEVQSAILIDGGYQPFAEKHILDNYPELFNTDWTVDYDEEDHELTIVYEDNTIEYISAADYGANSQYLVAYYYHYVPETYGTPTLHDFGADETDYSNLPDTAPYDYIGMDDDESGSDDFTLETKVTEEKVYSNGDPTTTTESSTFQGFSRDVTETYYESVDYFGSGDGTTVTTTADKQTYVIQERRHVVVVTTVTTVVNDIGGGHTETVTTTTETDTAEPIWNWNRKNSTITYTDIAGGYKMLIYKMGGTNAVLNALQTDLVDVDKEYFPFIPVRLNNVSITDTEFVTSGLYDSSRKAFRKAFGSNGFGEVIENVEDNPSLGDIDYAYISYGVPLNVIENASRDYLFRYFEYLQTYQSTTASDVTTFSTRVAQYELDLAVYRQWIADQENNGGGSGFGSSRPPLPVLNIPEITTIELRTNDPILSHNYDNRLSWYSIGKEVFSGVGKAGATIGDVWIEKGGLLSWSFQKATNSIPSEGGPDYDTLQFDVFYVTKQVTDTSYEKLTIYGMIHDNFVYGGKSVQITAHQAIDDEEESGFLVPLHAPTMRTMRLVDSTQMATANTYIVFNSYQIVKQPWYANGIFQAVLIVIAIVISIVTYGAGSPLAAGVLGTNAAVGASLGFTGAAALSVGAAANALAAIVLTQVLQYGARELLGDKLGPLVGAILAFVSIAALSPGGFDLSSLLSVQNIMEFTNVLANGYSDWVKADLLELQNEVANLTDNFEEQMDYISDMLKELGGTSDLSFNPLELTNVNAGNGSSDNFLPESLDEFIHRTTLVGSDIVDVTLAMVSDYSDLTLQLPKN